MCSGESGDTTLQSAVPQCLCSVHGCLSSTPRTCHSFSTTTTYFVVCLLTICGSCPRGDDADVWSTVSLMLWTGVLRRGSSLTQTKPNGYDLAPHHFCSLIITVGHNVIKPANCVCRTVDVPTCFACRPNVFLPSAPFALCTSATRP